MGYLILAVAVGFALWRDASIRDENVIQLNKVNASQCASLRNLYNVIRKSLEDSDKTIDELAYYKTHPEERAQAHARNQSTLMLFRLPPCPPAVQLEER